MNGMTIMLSLVEMWIKVSKSNKYSNTLYKLIFKSKPF